jgi:hypothetical protein
LEQGYPGVKEKVRQQRDTLVGVSSSLRLLLVPGNRDASLISFDRKRRAALLELPFLPEMESAD